MSNLPYLTLFLNGTSLTQNLGLGYVPDPLLHRILHISYLLPKYFKKAIKVNFL